MKRWKDSPLQGGVGKSLECQALFVDFAVSVCWETIFIMADHPLFCGACLHDNAQGSSGSSQHLDAN